MVRSWATDALRASSHGAERLAKRLQHPAVAESTLERGRRIDGDHLTDCVGRDRFAAGLRDALTALRRTPGTVGVISVNIDQFTALIASHGAAAGNEVLAVVAERLREGVRPHDMMTRIGGDGFAVMWQTASVDELGNHSGRTILDVAQRLARRFDKPIATSTGELRVTVSIGTAAVTDREAPTIDEATLMQQSSAAVQRAQSLGRSQVVGFDLSMEQQAVQQYQTENDLRVALQNGAVDVHYQPIVNLHSGAIVGLEALARWQHEAMGQMSPGLFIPIAEQSGLINELGAHVMSTAVRQRAEWHQVGHTDALVTLNLSGRQLLDRHLVRTIGDLLEEHDLDPSRLCLEITESVVMNDVATSMTILCMLKDLGVCLAIDDFGTGYSSLSYLRRLPVDILKIDRSFVHTIYNRDDRMIVKAIIDLAHTLGMTTVAEGIESQMQIEVLHALSCDMAQGFLLHPPTTAAELDLTPIDFSSRPETFTLLAPGPRAHHGSFI